MLLGNLPLPRLTIDELRQWEGPSIDDEIFAQFSVWLESAGDAATIAGIKRDAVRVARQRLGTFPYKYLLYENVPNLCSATYQVASAGRSRQRAVFDRRRIADPKVWLTERLGPLAYFAETEAEQPVAETQPATEPITAPLAADCPSDGIDWDTTLRSLAVGSAPDGGLILHTTGPASDALICAGIGDDAEDTAPPFEPACGAAAGLSIRPVTCSASATSRSRTGWSYARRTGSSAPRSYWAITSDRRCRSRRTRLVTCRARMPMSPDRCRPADQGRRRDVLASWGGVVENLPTRGRNPARSRSFQTLTVW